MYEDKQTGQLLPILIGTLMEDPAGTDLEVPIISVHRDPLSGKLLPLGGSTEDPEGTGVVPIMIGKKAVDSVTCELSPIIGKWICALIS